MSRATSIIILSTPSRAAVRGDEFRTCATVPEGFGGRWRIGVAAKVEFRTWDGTLTHARTLNGCRSR